MKIETEITIEAPRDKVWQHLINFSEYHRWNPFLTRIFGRAKQGANLIVMAKLPKFIFRLVPIVFHCKISEINEGESFYWKGKLIHSFFFVGEHFFILEELESSGRVRFIHGEKYSGILKFLIVPIISSKLGFEFMNKELKKISEKE